MDWKNYLEKNAIQKIEKKTVKIRVKLPRVNKKPLPRNRIFVQTPFSHSTLKLERKKIYVAKPLAFWLHFLFRRDQNHHSNLTSKIMKMCEQILKKKHSRKNSGNDSKEKIAHTYEWTTRTTIVNPDPPRMSENN